MNIYDGLIREAGALLSGNSPRIYPYIPEKSAPEGEKNTLILKRETAFELGESRFPSTSLLAVTDDETLVPKDQILLYGKDLTELRSDTPFARLTFLRTKAAWDAGEQERYALIQELELKKYELAPKGCMLRASAFSSREQLRVSKSAVRDGLGFAQLGNLFIRKYKENPGISAVTAIFIALPDAPYAALETLSQRCAQLTKALNHLFEDRDLDCRACEWKPVCDEVEGMKMLHNRVSQCKISEH